jgi:ketosteroid isomerase-like protein
MARDEEALRVEARADEGVRRALAGLDVAFAARDFNRALEFYTADAVLYLPGKPMLVGHAAIRAALIEAFGDPFVKVNVTIEHVEAHAGSVLAAVHGRGLTRVGDPASSTPIELHTNWLAVLRFERDAWRIALDMIQEAPEPPP